VSLLEQLALSNLEREAIEALRLRASSGLRCWRVVFDVAGAEKALEGTGKECFR
jgi:hypothetical protein